MTEPDLQQRLRKLGREFIESHDRAGEAIREAARAGMAPDAISHLSGLSPETVAAFLQANRD